MQAFKKSENESIPLIVQLAVSDHSYIDMRYGHVSPQPIFHVF